MAAQKKLQTIKNIHYQYITDTLCSRNVLRAPSFPDHAVSNLEMSNVGTGRYYG